MTKEDLKLAEMANRHWYALVDTNGMCVLRVVDSKDKLDITAKDRAIMEVHVVPCGLMTKIDATVERLLQENLLMRSALAGSEEDEDDDPDYPIIEPKTLTYH